MKMRVFFLKRKSIYYFLLLSLILITLLTTIKYKNTSAFKLLNSNKTIRRDLTGDGNEDNINITNKDNKYFITVKSQNKNYTLKNNENKSFIGDYNKFWPIKLNFQDISRDKIPEIFIQCSQYKMPIQYIFKWQNNEFKKLYSSNNNIIGLMDSNNNKTPKIISGNLKNNEIVFDSFIFMEDSIKRFDYNFNENFMGSNTIIEFINYIQSLPISEENRPKSILTDNISGKDISVIGNLVKENNIYTFQDANFKDIRNNNDGEINEIKWSLNFKGMSKQDNNLVKNYSIDVLLKLVDNPDDNHRFKIYSITLN
ncbi:hypothetical protein ACFLKB_01040 [Clostridium sp. FAM 1755]|uniref:VCBS repeat-containing protein n=2 Tax=Clostridium TaxID=1485 RepID=A0A6M0T1A5_CLOBO|nr:MULTISPECIES: hypothetical protein [Clostridium]NFA61547.1 hypothetical protein [Clostridium botulinum]KOR23766.1 hypothetical protein ND00_33600 [Clostridium sp. L74]MDS1004579.1 hypothetical protein [Clostridium sporogenes]NFI74540.1 hypothetical protein [Clostridium sporogenes]NFL71907.1 hypothetical protein [Clostridium sporogenes]